MQRKYPRKNNKGRFHVIEGGKNLLSAEEEARIKAEEIRNKAKKILGGKSKEEIDSIKAIFFSSDGEILEFFASANNAIKKGIEMADALALYKYFKLEFEERANHKSKQ